MKTTTTPLTTARWAALAQSVAEAFRMPAAEAEALERSMTARMIGALPFLAGCDQAERTAITHVSVYVLSSRGANRAAFDHLPEDDVHPRRRLASIENFQGGDPAILERGMNLLTLQMLCGYARDQAKDLVTGEYNPLLSGAWNAEALRDELIAKIVDTPCPEMDGVMTIHDAQANWWS